MCPSGPFDEIVQIPPVATIMETARLGRGSVVVYQSDYVAPREEIKLIDPTAGIKKCKIGLHTVKPE
jgi:hypothetical protein